ncbi:MAG TPA: hypothetical protein PKW35_12690, partial [Nannocystaceae bacterium]|nr:hypothetical protein [Nannocystaceae bacterium]
DRSPARVQLKSGSFLYVYVRLKQGADAQTLIVKPLREIELAAGRYEVEIRQEPTAPWRSIGEIRVRAGGSYEARMGENAVTLRELEAPAG